MHGCDIVSEDVKGAIKLILVSSQWGGDDCGMRGKAMWAGRVHILNFIFKTLRLTQNNIADNRWQLGVKLLKLITKHERVSISFDEFLSAHDFNLFILKLFFLWRFVSVGVSIEFTPLTWKTIQFTNYYHQQIYHGESSIRFKSLLIYCWRFSSSLIKLYAALAERENGWDSIN